MAATLLSNLGDEDISTTGQIVGGGTTTNDSAAAGIIGEFQQSLVSIGNAVSITTATATNITSLSLTAGDWDVEGHLIFKSSGATVTVNFAATIGTSSAAIATDGSECNSNLQGAYQPGNHALVMSRKRISLAATTTVYLVGSVSFSGGTFAGYGELSARRVR